VRELRTRCGLSTLDAEQVGLIYGTALRLLLERRYPDGLDADDIREVIASGTKPGADPDVLLIVLAGALGIHPEEADQVPRPAPEAIELHAVALLSTLAAPRRPEIAVATAIQELAMLGRMEQP
jgi:hypothetical protein